MANNKRDNEVFCDLNIIGKIKLLKAVFNGDETIIFQQIAPNAVYLVYSDGLVDTEIINRDIVSPIKKQYIHDGNSHADTLAGAIDVAVQKKFETLEDAVKSVLSGETVVLIHGLRGGVSADVKSKHMRAISEPENEKILSGPRQGFNENIQNNLSLVKRIICSEKMQIKTLELGRTTGTKVAVMFLKDITEPTVVRELIRRLKKIDIDGIIDSNYITEQIRDCEFSVFRTTGSTERPDIVAGKLLEGRVAVFVNGSPVVLTLPYLFVENFQSNEDYYLNFYYAGFSRILRILGFLITCLVPAIYISIVAFHHEMLPSPLMISIAIERSNVPLPVVIEAIVLLFVFELLRETAVRMPSNIGQTFSIVGALVLGQAAVKAKLVAAPMIIVVAITGITGLLIPKLKGPIIFCRLFLILCASVFGFTGVTLGVTLITLRILTLTSLGVTQLLSKKIDVQSMKDTFVRFPWKNMITRPRKLTANRIRQKKDTSS